MQDSSTNPYIPQENEQIRAATQPLSSPLKRTVKLLMIITGVLAVLVIIGFIVIVPRTSADDPKARLELAHTLQPPATLSKLVPVKSTLGFNLKYDNQMFVSYAETVPPVVNGKKEASDYYENDDLRTPRDYSMVRITPAESADSDRSAVADPPQLVITSDITIDELKANETKPDYKGLSQQALFVKLSTDQRLAKKTADDGTTVTIDATKPSSQTINDIKYQKVRFTTKNENYRIINYKYDDCYYTIQHNTPYSVCVTNVRPNSRDDAALVESLVQTLAFQKPTEEEAVAESTSSTGEKKEAKPVEKAVVKEEEPLPLETPKPEYASNPANIVAFAKNQPSIVRIGTLYCADLNLKVASGEVLTTLTDACVGNLSSGTLVSKDGHIATTGHAIRYDPKAAINGYVNFADSQRDLLERLDRVLKYLLDARLILESDAEYLRNGAQIGDQDAMAKIENIGSIIPDNYVTPTKDNYSYAIQPTDKPLVLDTSTGARPVFAYSDTVIPAKFVAANYDADKSAQESFDSPTPAKDIGLLKAEGSFQNVALGLGSAIKSNDQLAVISFPSYSDGSLVIGKHQNAPVVTEGSVEQTYDKEGQQLIQFATPIIPGADGGGVFDQAGRLVGVGVYGLSYCPDKQCFATGTIRPSDELTALLDDKNMTLGQLSEATTAWQSGIDEYFKGNYASASAHFAKAGGLYGYNRFAEPLQKLATSKQGSTSDTSLMNQLVGIMIAVLVISTVLTIVCVIVFILQKRRLDSLQVGHYGAQTPIAPVTPAAPQPVATAPAQQMPVQQVPVQPQPYTPTPQAPPVQQPSQQQGVPQPQPYQPQQPSATPPQEYMQPQQPQAYTQGQPPSQQGSAQNEDPFYRQ